MMKEKQINEEIQEHERKIGKPSTTKKNGDRGEGRGVAMTIAKLAGG